MEKIRNTPLHRKKYFWGEGAKKMTAKNKQPVRLEDIPKMEEKERRKYEIAEELGLLDKVLESGWKSLSSKETGRIGGIISKKRKES